MGSYPSDGDVFSLAVTRWIFLQPPVQELIKAQTE